MCSRCCLRRTRWRCFLCRWLSCSCARQGLGGWLGAGAPGCSSASLGSFSKGSLHTFTEQLCTQLLRVHVTEAALPGPSLWAFPALCSLLARALSEAVALMIFVSTRRAWKLPYHPHPHSFIGLQIWCLNDGYVLLFPLTECSQDIQKNSEENKLSTSTGNKRAGVILTDVTHRISDLYSLMALEVVSRDLGAFAG